MSVPSFYHYWGKARPSVESAPAYHLLPYHCLDVAAVGVEALTRLPSLRALISSRLGIADSTSPCILDGWVAFWFALHDLGKFAESFQSQRPDLFGQLRARAPSPTKPYRLRHDSLGMLFWREVLCDQACAATWFGPSTNDHVDGFDYWARAVTGHHGQPPDESGFWEQHFDRSEDRAAVLEFVEALRPLLLGDGATLVNHMDDEQFLAASVELSWWTAGLAVLADWLGSNTDFFPYHDLNSSSLSMADYWALARSQAKAALDASGIQTLPSTHQLTLQELFPSIATPSPLQDWATSAELQPGPQLHLMEDVTGAGKTEAAVMLAHRLMAEGIADGLFVGLPTMATANAMYGRVAQVYARLFESEASLVLASSQRNLVEAFAASVIRPGLAENDDRQSDETATSRCTAWLADHNKRALLAPAGVGTIDQALLAVLQSKHQSLRLLGLTRKVLVVDEVHACDDYMQGVLGALLEFHARAGGSAILLSATLPLRMKRTLLRAFARGCDASAGESRSIDPLSTDYPLVTSWASARSAELLEQAVATRADVMRSVVVQSTNDEAQVHAAIYSALAAGKCVCWIRNTIGDALAAHAAFQTTLPPERLALFHARFTLQDRLRIEQTVLGCFGRDSGPVERAGRLLIATQVVEQSLDVDFDLVVSDLAPIDRVVQRAGRLRRHPRKSDGARLDDPDARDERGPSCLWVLTPEWAEEPAKDWYKAAFPRAAAVYPHHGRLWLTARALREGTFTMPDHARTLIEGVFGDDADIPVGLQGNADAAEGQAFAELSQAQMNTIKLSRGYSRGGVDWWSEAKTPSRLGEQTVTVLLARWHGDELQPWVGGEHCWTYSSVRLAERLIVEATEPTNERRREAVARTKLTLPGQGKWSVLLPMESTPDGFRTTAYSAPDRRGVRKTSTWCYDATMGLQLFKPLEGGDHE